MANQSISLPVVAGDGVGAAVAASGLAPAKTMILGGLEQGVITVEISQNGTDFAPLATFATDGKRRRTAAALFMRARSSAVVGTPSLDVGAETAAAGGVTLVAPPSDGVGASADVTNFGSLITFIVGGTLEGFATLTIEGSTDDVDYAPLATFQQPGSKTLENVAVRFMRVRASNVTSLPYAPVVGIMGIPGAAGGGGVAQNVSTVRQAPATTPIQRDIYVRPTGNDTTGDGSVGNPYATIVRALEEVPTYIVGEQYIIDCTGVTEVISEPIVLGPFECPDDITIDFTPAILPFFFQAALTLRAAPTVVATFTGGEITGSAQEPFSQLRTYNTNQSFTLNELKGAFLIDAVGFAFAIASNTAGPNSDIEVCTDQDFTALTYPIQIVTPSCEIQNTSGGHCLLWRGQNCPLQLDGIRLNAVGGSAAALRIDSIVSPVGLLLCQMNGFNQFGGAAPGNDPAFISCYFENLSGGGAIFGQQSSCTFNDCYFDSISVSFRHSGVAAETLFWRTCIFDGLTGRLGVDTSIANINSISLALDRAIVRNSTTEAFFCPPLGAIELDDVLIENCAGNAFRAGGSPRCTLFSVGGSGNTGHGVQLENGAQVFVNASVAVTGASGDYKVGGNAASAGAGAGWAALGAAENDLALGATSQICRLFK
jgi:hypothetical protein